MKKSLAFLVVLSVMVLAAMAPAQTTRYVASTGSDVTGDGSLGNPWQHIQYAIAHSVANDIISIAAGTYAEGVVVSMSLNLTGAGSGTIITNASGIGITVAANNVTLQSLKVNGCSDHGIYASGVTGLNINGVSATNNGTTGNKRSGISLHGVTTGSSVTNVTATGNKGHGLEIGNGSTGVHVSGGTFNGNGIEGDQSTGGGIIIFADAGKTTNSTLIDGTVDASNNFTAGIYVFCDATGVISGTTIGESPTTNVTLNNNGSNSGADLGGAAVLLFGPCDNTTISASANSGTRTKSAGLVVLGLSSAGLHSPTATVVKNSTLTGYSDANHPAGTMTATQGATTYISNQDVDATDGDNLINGFTTGFEVEDALNHKVDNSQLGLFRGPGTVLYVTPNSGSIQRAIDIANNPYSVTQINVKDGTYVENVIVNEAIVLNGQGANTIINPGSGTTIDVTVASVTLSNLHIYLYGAFTPFAGTTATTNTFTFRAQAKVFLQGPYVGAGTMSTTLQTSAIIPAAQPFNVAPFNYAGTENAAAPSGVVDWILVELRSGTTGATKTGMRACFLKNDGTVLETDGTAGVMVTDTIPSGYDLTGYVVIKHRNHLAVMSAAGVAMPNGSAYDFTADSAMAYLPANNPMKNLTGLPTGSGGVYAMWMGDANADGVVKFNLTNNDKLLIYNRIGNAGFNLTVNGYYMEDLNLDGVVKFNLTNNDKLFIYNVIGNAGFNLTKSTQVPN